MPRDAAATRARILDAAIEEFTRHGLAGARVDRIAKASGANPRSIYVYFENKETLFDTALHQVIGELATAVPLTEDDLPGYAGRMFDYLVAHPQALRMSQWRQLERPGAGPDDSDLYAEKIGAMASGRAAARSGLPPADLIVLVIGLSVAWLNSPEGLLAADGRPLRVDPIEEARRQWAARWPDAPLPAMAAVTSVMRAQQVLLAHLNDALRPFGLTFARYEALMLLLFARDGALPLGKVGERLQVHRTSVTNIVDKLERDGLVRRVPHTEDRRATLAEITPEGERVARAATKALHAIEFAMGALGPADQDAVTTLLRELRVAAGDFAV